MQPVLRCSATPRQSMAARKSAVSDSFFGWAHNRSVTQFLLGLDPILDIPSVLAAAFNIQLMSSASDLFPR